MTDQHQSVTLPQPPKRDWHGAHHPWSYSAHAFRWTGELISGLNILPLATEMRAWMLRRGHLSLMPPPNSPTNGGFTNPYTANGITLSLLMSSVVNASHDFATKPIENDDEVNVEIERIRLYNELLLYSARFCEVIIKQLLHCTQIPTSLYQRMALGQLLESPCPYCKRKNGQEPHLISLVGTLAHPFHLCLEFEHCAMDHMDLVNKLRNSQAAHSEVQTLNIRPISESKAQLFHDSHEVLCGFVHMLSHLEDLERKMLKDLAKKGAAINNLKRAGLAREDRNFDLVPGQPFLFNPERASDSTA